MLPEAATAARADVARVPVLGVSVSAVSMDETLDVFDGWITGDART
jgi:hypothetical protein